MYRAFHSAVSHDPPHRPIAAQQQAGVREIARSGADEFWAKTENLLDNGVFARYHLTKLVSAFVKLCRKGEK
jgi:hypothetical protein